MLQITSHLTSTIADNTRNQCTRLGLTSCRSEDSSRTDDAAKESVAQSKMKVRENDTVFGNVDLYGDEVQSK